MTDDYREKLLISKKQLHDLIDDQRRLYALQAAGVDNWEGYEHAMDIVEEVTDVRTVITEPKRPPMIAVFCGTQKIFDQFLRDCGIFLTITSRRFVYINGWEKVRGFQFNCIISLHGWYEHDDAGDWINEIRAHAVNGYRTISLEGRLQYDLFVQAVSLTRPVEPHYVEVDVA